jgi:hypothetical protein
MAKKTKRRKIKPLWLCRDNGASQQNYYVYISKPQFDTYGTGLRHGVWDTRDGGGVDMCPEEFEACTPKSLHLKPGGGPVQVKLVRV